MSATSSSNSLNIILIMAIFSSIIISLTYQSKSKEEVMAERIVILEKAKDSTDPAVLAMAKSIQEEITKEQEQKEQSRIAKEQRDKFFEENKLAIVIAVVIFNILAMLFVFKIFNRN